MNHDVCVGAAIVQLLWLQNACQALFVHGFSRQWATRWVAMHSPEICLPRDWPASYTAVILTICLASLWTMIHLNNPKLLQQTALHGQSSVSVSLKVPAELSNIKAIFLHWKMQQINKSCTYNPKVATFQWFWKFWYSYQNNQEVKCDSPFTGSGHYSFEIIYL